MNSIIAKLDDCTAGFKALCEDIRAIRDNFISPDYNTMGVIWRVVDGKKVGFRQYGAWTEKRSINFQVLYEQIVTYAGSTMEINLDFQVNVMLNRIEMISSDNTAKGFEWRAYTDYNHDSYYNLIGKGIANQTTRILQMYEKEFMPAGSRIQFYFDNFTAGKTNKIIVGVEEV